VRRVSLAQSLAQLAQPDAAARASPTPKRVSVAPGMTHGVYGQYVVKTKLGEGGMGVVYEAIHPKLEKRVALKTLHPRYVEDAELVARFVREARAAARIRHPHVVDVTDVGMADGAPYLVMELLEGESLASRIAREAPLPAATAVDLLLPVCSALEAVHQTGVLHRDLKPENVFLARSAGSSGVHPKVLDFGIARIAGDDVRLTGRAQLIGTPFYMSLEQAKDPTSVDPRADQYALGVILYECVTGTRPFPGDSASEILTALVIGQPKPPRSIVPSLSPSLEAVIQRAMAQRADDRFPSVRALGAALIPHASARGRAQWSTAFGVGTIPPPGMDDAPVARAAGPARILVIEDDEDIRENLIEMLEAEGFEATSARTGDEGVAAFRASPPDLVICDVALPGLDGHQVVRALRADPATRTTAFVFLSGRAERSDIRAGMNQGADDYLTKPFSRVELLEAVRTRLARHARPAASDTSPRAEAERAATLLSQKR
jgi:CheY-like chemotaxis protein